MNSGHPHAQLYPQHVQQLQSRANQALSRGGFDHLVIPSGTLHTQVFDDRDDPYAVNPQFKAWLPLLDAPGSWLVYTPDKTPRLIYLQPHDYWHSVPGEPSGEWADAFEIIVIREPAQALKHLPADAGRCAILGDPRSALGDYLPNNPKAVLDYLEYHRAFKTPYEIQMMRQANRIGARAHRMAERAFRAGASEFGIHMAYCQAAGQDANDLPYGNIVAINEHAAVLHYTRRDRVPARPARSFLIDAGASHAGYAADITRTHAGDAGGEFQALIDAVDRVQRDLCAQVKPGVDYRQIHLSAHHQLADVLHAAGLISCTAEAAVQSGISSAFFPHGIGHGLGLQVHDVAGFSASDSGGTIPKPEGHPYLRLTRTLQDGMVVTIEPGLYIIDMLLDKVKTGSHRNSVNWDKVAELRPYGGIRIEDNVVCTTGEPVNLTRDAFSELAVS